MRTLLGAILGLLLVVPGAASSGTSAAPSTGTSVPPVWSATSPVPTGWQAARCPWLTTEHSEARTVVVPLPSRYGKPSAFRGEVADRGECYIYGRRYDGTSVVVTLATEDSLAATRLPDEGDGTSDVEYAADVPVLGGRSGERLSFVSDDDGALKAYRAEQADGILVEWIVPAEDAERLAGEIDAGMAGVAVEDTRTAGCARGTGAARREVVVTLPASTRMVTWLHGVCSVVPTAGHAARREVRIDPAPTSSLATLRKRLAHDSFVTRLRQVGPHRLRYVAVIRPGDPVGWQVDQRDGLRTTLVSPRVKWRTDLPTYAALRASIRRVR